MSEKDENKVVNGSDKKIGKRETLLLIITILLLVVIILLMVMFWNKDDDKNELLINNNEVNNKIDDSNGGDATASGDDNSLDDNKYSEDNNDQDKNNYSEDEVVAYFDNMEKEITESKWDSVKEKAKDYFITVVDFIFYDKEVKGYSFKELTGTAKIKIISVALKIDSKIEEKVPGYKETISSTSEAVYSDVKERLVESYLDISTVICKNNASECETAKNIFGEIKSGCKIGWDFIKKLVTSGASKLKDWYEIYSGK